DAANMRVRRISRDGIITTVAGNGTPGYGGDRAAGVDAALNWPKDVAIDGQANLYIADTANHAIRKVSASGVITNVAGTGAPGFAGDNAAGTSALLNEPSGLAIDDAGNLFVSDTNNFRVRKLSTTGVITTIAGNGSKGYSGDGGPATAAQLMNPTGLAFDRSGNLFVGDGESERMISRDGLITTVPGNGTGVGFTGEGGPAVTAQTGAWGLAFNASGKLYLSDPWN